MAAVGVIVDNFVGLWGTPSVRQNFPWLFLLISVVGSGLKLADVVPETYFSSSRNVLNVYFVKLSWGWTLLLLTPFIFLSNAIIRRRDVIFLSRRLLSLAVATAIWYVCTETFFFIEDYTGHCFETTETADVIHEEFVSKGSCRRAGYHWDGYDISGHSFILAYSALFIVEEMAPMACLKTVSLPTLTRLVLNLLYLALNAIVILWIWMFGCTSVYFHNLDHKVLGTGCGILAWYVTYRLWYPKPLSPGLPPLRQPRDQ